MNAVQEAEEVSDLPVVPFGATTPQRKLSRGYYTTVWAVTTADGKAYAEKKVRESKNTKCTPEWIACLERGLQQECRLLVQLTHPNIVTVEGVSFAECCGDSVIPRRPISLIMEIMEDGNLDDYIASKKRDIKMDEQLQHMVLLDIARGLQYMHSKDVVHYTLNSRKVLLTFRRRDIRVLAKICGFGAAAMECRRPHHLLTDEENRGQISQSTLDLYPPEVFCGLDANDAKGVDIFSFGLVILQTLTQDNPTPKAMMDSHDRLISEVERREEHLNMLDDEHPLKPTVMECLSNEPQYRPTAETLLSIIQVSELRTLIPIAEVDSMRQAHAQAVFRLRSEKERLRGEKERLTQRLDELLDQKEEQIRELQQRVERLKQQNTRQTLELSILREGEQRVQRRPALVQSLSVPGATGQTHTPLVDHRIHLGVEDTILRSEVQIIQEIDRGAWAVVARGRYRERVVAVKWPHQQLLEQYRDIVPRLEREVTIMAQLRHPNLAHFIGAVIDDDARHLRESPLLLTELMDTNLRLEYSRCKAENILFPKTLLHSIFLDVAYGLHCLHTHNEPIIHRDISAPNVLLKRMPNGCWQAKISDFGSANLQSIAHSLGEGAILYSPPEVFPMPHANQPILQTVKIDIFSYGILLCEVIAAQLPETKHYQGMLRTVAEQWSIMHTLIEQCTQHSPTARPTATEIIDGLHQIPRPSLRTQVSV